MLVTSMLVARNGSSEIFRVNGFKFEIQNKFELCCAIAFHKLSVAQRHG